MNRTTTLSLLVVLAALLVALPAPGVGAAQTGGNATTTATATTSAATTSTATPTPTPTSTATATPTSTTTATTTATTEEQTTEQTTAPPTSSSDDGEDSEPESYVAQLDGATRIVDYSYSAGTFTITVEADTPTMVAVSDALGPFANGGASNIPMTKKLVPIGTTEITMDVSEWDGRAGVSVSTSRGAVALSTEATGGSSIWPDQSSDRLAMLAGLALPPLGAICWGRYRGSQDATEVNVIDESE